MPKPSCDLEPSQLDQLVFEKLVPKEQVLPQAKQIIDVARVRELATDCSRADSGRTAEDPLGLLRLGYRQFQ